MQTSPMNPQNAQQQMQRGQNQHQNPGMMTNVSQQQSPAIMMNGSMQHSPAMMMNGSMQQSPGMVTNGLMQQGPGMMMQSPGMMMNGSMQQSPGMMMQSPGMMMQSPGMMMNGSIQQGPGVMMQSPGMTMNGSMQQSPGMMMQTPGMMMNGSIQQSPGMVTNGLIQQSPGMTTNGPIQQSPGMMTNGSLQQTQRPTAAVEGTTLKAKVLYDYVGDGPNQMKLTAGDIVDILTRGAPGGWCRGVNGAFPTDYVEILSTGNTTVGSSAFTPQSAATPLNSFKLGPLRNMSTESTNSGQARTISKLSSRDESGKLRIEISPSPKSGGLNLQGMLIQPAPSASTGSLLDLDLVPETGIERKSMLTSASASKGSNYDIYNSNSISVAPSASVVSLLDLDDDRPSSISAGSVSTSKMGSMVQHGNSGSILADALDGIDLSNSLSNVSSSQTSMRNNAEKSKTGLSISNTNSSMMMSFDRLDMGANLFGNSSGKSATNSQAIGNLMDMSNDDDNVTRQTTASNLSSAFMCCQIDDVKKSDSKPPPVAARVIPPTVYARAIYTRQSEGPTELSLECGDFILVETKSSEWWYGSIVTSSGMGNKTGSRSGFFPGNYVDIVDSDVVSAASLSLANTTVLPDKSNPFDSFMTTASSGMNKVLSLSPAMSKQKESSALLLPNRSEFSGMGRNTTIAKYSSTFVCSVSIDENIPIWKHPIFADFFVDFHVPHPLPPLVVSDPKQPNITNHTIKNMSVTLKLVCVSLQRAREIFINPKNRISTDDDVRNEYLSQVLMHSISVFSEASKLCDKLPANSGDLFNSLPLRLLMHVFY